MRNGFGDAITHYEYGELGKVTKIMVARAGDERDVPARHNLNTNIM